LSNNISDIVDLIHPTASGIGVILSDQVWVLFDREIDETTLSVGNLFITGPDTDTWSGPDLQLFTSALSLSDEKEILQSPGYDGIVQGDITFERISLTSTSIVNTEDTVASGFLYRTKAIFTPTNRLAVDTSYNVYLSGDEDTNDSLLTGISERTVFDTVASGINTGTGEAVFTGGYNGLVSDDIYTIQITTSGEIGDARFTFWRDSDISSVFGPFKTKLSGVVLSDGVTVGFSEGTYGLGDLFYARVKEPVTFTGNLYWPFKTGSGSIQTIPTTASTSVIGDTAVSVQSSTTGGTFRVLSTSPADIGTNQTIPVGTFDINITFNNNIDPLTVASGSSYTVLAESVDGFPEHTSNGILIASPSVSDNVLTITVASGELYNNNIVIVTLEDTIQDTDGNYLGTDYQFSFSTTYYPMYSTLRRIRLDIGMFIQDISDDTINLAIFEASKESMYMVWNTNNTDDSYFKFIRTQWVTCKAESILLNNILGGISAVKSKRLGDLEVTYENSKANATSALNKVLDCIDKWQGALQAGGRQVQSPQYVVKGEADPDRPPIGRGWIHARNLNMTQVPMANDKYRLRGSRRYRGTNSNGLPWGRGWWKR
jgi:hypothetical protein